MSTSATGRIRTFAPCRSGGFQDRSLTATWVLLHMEAPHNDASAIKLLGEQFQSRASPVGFHILQFGFCFQEVGPSSVPLCGTIFSSRLLRMLSQSEKFIYRLHQEHSPVLVYQQLFNTFLFLNRTNHSLHLSCNGSAYL